MRASIVGHDVAAASPESARAAVIAGDGEARAVKPFAHYPGCKDAAGAAEQIIRRFPPHSVYVEPFLGNGAVLRKKTPALRTLGVDDDARVVEAWRRVRWPGLELYHCCGIEFMEAAAAWLPADGLVYVDPPYPMWVRSGKRLYAHELTRADHERILAAALALPCAVVVSSYPNELYADALRGWGYAEFPAMTRGGVRTEALWWRGGGVGLGADPRYVGRNFRERERIKRKCARWASRFTMTPAGERAALLQALLNAAAGIAGDGEGAPSSEVASGSSRRF